MGKVFQNTKRLPSKEGRNRGAIEPFLTAASTGLPLEVPDDHRLVKTLSRMGTPVSPPEGLETSKLDELQEAA